MINKELFKYFTTDNISGKKCTEKWLSKNNNKLFKNIINWCDSTTKLQDLEFKRKVYHYVNKIKIIPKVVNLHTLFRMLFVLNLGLFIFGSKRGCIVGSIICICVRQSPRKLWSIFNHHTQTYSTRVHANTRLSH